MGMLGMRDDQTFSTSSTTGTVGRRRRTLMFGAVLLLVVSAVAIILGVVLSKDDGKTEKDSKATIGGGNALDPAPDLPKISRSPTPPPSAEPTTIGLATKAPSSAMPVVPTAPSTTGAPIVNTPETSESPSLSLVSPVASEAPIASIAPDSTAAPIESAAPATITFTPITPAPTNAETPAPTSAMPTTASPILIPIGPTNAPVTPAPTEVDATAAPVSPAPTVAPFTPAPVLSPVTPAPTVAPVTQAPVLSPVTPAPTPVPISPAPVRSPPTREPTLPPVTPDPTIAISGSPSSAPIAIPPTFLDPIDQLIRSIAIFDGEEFDVLNSYQSKALRWLKRDVAINTWSDDRLIQRYALACVYYSTNNVRHTWTDFSFGDGVIHPWYDELNWLTSLSECEWFRVECDNSDVVKELLLYNNRLTGSLPREMTLLSSIRRIDLFDNFIWNAGDAGNAWLGEMTSLRYLLYGNTYFEYDGVPPQISNLVNLIEYDCSYTLYYGALTDEPFIGLDNLNYLNLNGNVYLSSIPSAVASLPNLEWLYAADTSLTGTMDFILDMPMIFEVWFDFNDIEGTIPTEIGLVSTLGSLSATLNFLVGTIPTEMGNLDLMQQIWFQNNTLTGEIPSELGNLGDLTTLDLAGNNLSGAVPDLICTLPLFEFVTDCDIDCGCCTECL